jgi:hypothetical protein
MEKSQHIKALNNLFLIQPIQPIQPIQQIKQNKYIKELNELQLVQKNYQEIIDKMLKEQFKQNEEIIKNELKLNYEL